MGKILVSIDVETTGLSFKKDRIIEIGIVVFGVHTISTFTSLVNPCIPIPREITKLTGIRDNHVRHAPTMKEIRPIILSLLGKNKCIGHNIEFDKQFLKREGIKIMNLRTIDTLAIARRKKMSSRNDLMTLCKHYRIPIKRKHRALDDAQATAKLYRHLTLNVR